ncbi:MULTISPECIES: hypothetical protein [Arcobacteraceae]|uniref:Uncharacterized protein n=3 Tax=Arcobacteraceae TaxID=2808963 RepID=A0A1C0B098_9BACT|nr:MULTISPECIES: hypothetical protein [Arcobacteraceae]OCL82145.1 hypothetical protein AAW29_01522 [Arcobacter porcinus]OCL84934.1 hypothetical protein AAW30_00076 [Arcobacter porcinus]OCL86461.1 hypothetical protein AAX27_02092 [Aliarcobacter thereius]OCL86476.1 hypothetical protein AAX30_01199 [Arcobacter porcinus]OCL87112.1 hypothetical protein AAX26_01420 [Aliarcobacter thereius]
MIKLNSKNSLFIAYIIFFTAIFIFLPRIYVKNNIYYVSKDINRLYSQYISLNEENIFLAKQLEEIKFKNQVLDSMIVNPLFED